MPNQSNKGIPPTTAWWIVLGLTAAALLAARWYLCFREPQLSFGDEHSYLEIAKNLVEHHAYRLDRELMPRESWVGGKPPGAGGWIGFSIRQAPGLPFSLAMLGQAVPLTALTAKLLNATIGWLTVLLYGVASYWLTRSRLAALVVMLATGLHPSFLFLNTTNYPQTFQAFWLGGLVLLAVHLNRHHPTQKPSPGMGLLEGLVLGVGALYVPAQLFILPAMALTRRVRPFGRWLLYCATLCVGFALPLCPWIIRNAISEKAFIPFCTTGGEAMFMGFNDHAAANLYAGGAEGDAVTGLSELPADFREKVMAATTGKQRQDLYAAAAVAWIKTHPKDAARLWVAKTLNFFRWDVGRMHTKLQGSDRLRLWLCRLTTIFVFAVFVLGYLVATPDQKPWFLFSILALIFLACGYAFYITRYRYRLPFEPLLLFAGLSAIVADWQTRQRGPGAKNSRASV